ncbi:MAG TPA: hypothetical protein ACFYD2_00045, partial [Candidatus Avalokitesvara rifleensis]
MDRDLNTFTLKASYVIPSPGEVLEGGGVVVRGGKIVDVRSSGKHKASGEEIDLGEAVIIPGLINAHAHLELTDLEGKIPPPKSFT